MIIDERVVSIPEMMARRAIKSRQSIYNHVAAGILPPIRSFGLRRKGWYASDVAAWFERERLLREDHPLKKIMHKKQIG